MPFFSFLDDSSGITAVFAKDAVRFRPIRKFAMQVMRGRSALSVADRELIAAFVSLLNQCEFCAAGHAAFVARTVDPSILDGLMANIESAAISDHLKPIFRFVKKLTEEPSGIVQADVDSVLAAGWEESALEDVIAVCAFFNMLNRIADGYGLRASGGWWRTKETAVG